MLIRLSTRHERTNQLSFNEKKEKQSEDTVIAKVCWFGCDRVDDLRSDRRDKPGDGLHVVRNNVERLEPKHKLERGHVSECHHGPGHD
jgi:hypothetical protein